MVVGLAVSVGSTLAFFGCNCVHVVWLWLRIWLCRLWFGVRSVLLWLWVWLCWFCSAMLLVACDCVFGCVSSVLVLIGCGCWVWSVGVVRYWLCLVVLVGLAVLV